MLLRRLHEVGRVHRLACRSRLRFGGAGRCRPGLCTAAAAAAAAQDLLDARLILQQVQVVTGNVHGEVALELDELVQDGALGGQVRLLDLQGAPQAPQGGEPREHGPLRQRCPRVDHRLELLDLGVDVGDRVLRQRARLLHVLEQAPDERRVLLPVTRLVLQAGLRRRDRAGARELDPKQGGVPLAHAVDLDALGVQVGGQRRDGSEHLVGYVGDGGAPFPQVPVQQANAQRDVDQRGQLLALLVDGHLGEHQDAILGQGRLHGGGHLPLRLTVQRRRAGVQRQDVEDELVDGRQLAIAAQAGSELDDLLDGGVGVGGQLGGRIAQLALGLHLDPIDRRLHLDGLHGRRIRVQDPGGRHLHDRLHLLGRQRRLERQAAGRVQRHRPQRVRGDPFRARAMLALASLRDAIRDLLEMVQDRADRRDRRRHGRRSSRRRIVGTPQTISLRTRPTRWWPTPRRSMLQLLTVRWRAKTAAQWPTGRAAASPASSDPDPAVSRTFCTYSDT